MTEHELMHKAIAGSMPDIEAVRNKCINQVERISSDESKRNCRTKRFVTVSACAVIVVAVACAIPYMNTPAKINSVSEDSAVISAANPAESISQQSKSAIMPFITVNELAKLPSACKMNNIALLTNDFIKMNRQELCDFYEVNVFPSALPKDLSEAQNPTYGIYRRDNGTGDVYFSQNELSYTNLSATETLTIDISKGQLPYTDIETFENGRDIKSTLNGNELSVGHYSTDENDYYYAEFSYHNIGFRIISDNLTKAEFIDMLSSILK